MRSEFKVQNQTRRNWQMVQNLGTEGGGMNAGIFKVKLVGDPYDRYFIEKRFEEDIIGRGWATKEIMLMNQLKDHDGVVKVVDHFVDEHAKKASVFMEFCDVGDLAGVIKGARAAGPVNEHKIWKWLIDLMDTLVYLHRGPKPEDDRSVHLYWNVIYHRDIKPANIFLKTDRQKGEIVAKLADFGASDSAHYSFQTKERHALRETDVYTDGWEPPEHPLYSGATDVWQLALSIASICVPNLSPRSRNNPQGQGWDKNQPAGRNYSRELNEILKWCLDDNANRRPRPLEISKRLKETYSRIKNHLRRDDKPMEVVRQAKDSAKGAQAPQPESSPGLGALEGQRPGIPPHAFSDSALQRTDHTNDRYGAYVQNQRAPMSPRAVNEVIRNGGGTPQPVLPGGFVPAYGPPGLGKGYFPQYGPGNGGYRKY
jgi:NIMA (never in mitosis gene a)-related kinase